MDRSFHFGLPLLAYTMIACAAYAALSHATEALFAFAAGILFLLFIAIHNAWDAVAYHVLVSAPKAGDDMRE